MATPMAPFGFVSALFGVGTCKASFLGQQTVISCGKHASVDRYGRTRSDICARRNYSLPKSQRRPKKRRGPDVRPPRQQVLTPRREARRRLKRQMLIDMEGDLREAEAYYYSQRTLSRLRTLLRRGEHERALREYRAIGNVHTIEYFHQLISLFGSLHSTAAAQEILHDLMRVHEPTTATFNTVMVVRLKQRDAKGVWMAFDLLKGEQFVPTTYTYTILLNACALEDDAARAEKLLRQMTVERVPLTPNIVTYNTLLKIYVRRNDLRRSQITVARLLRGRLKPNRITHVLLLNLFVQRGELASAKAVVERLKRIGYKAYDVAVVGALIRYHGALGDREHALQLLQSLQSSGAYVDAAAFSEAVEVAGSSDTVHSKDKSPARSFTSNASGTSTSPLPPQPVALSARSLCSVLQRLANSLPSTGRDVKGITAANLQHDRNTRHNEDVAVSYLFALERPPRLRLRSALFNSALREIVRRNDVHTAIFTLRVMQTLSENNLLGSQAAPNVATFSILIRMFAIRGDSVSGAVLFEHMRTQLATRPDRGAWSALLEACARAGDTRRAVKAVGDMRAEGGIVAPGVREYSLLAEAHARAGDEQGALDVAMEMEQSNVRADVVMLNSVLNAFAERKMVDAARLWRERLQDPDKFHRVVGDDTTFNTFVKALVRANRLEDAEEELSGPNAPANASALIAYNTLLAGCARAGEVRQAARVMSVLDRASRTSESDQATASSIPSSEALLAPDGRSFGSLVRAHLTAGDAMEALHSLRRMLRRGFRPHAALVQQLLTALHEAGEIELVKQLRHDADTAGIFVRENVSTELRAQGDTTS